MPCLNFVSGKPLYLLGHICSVTDIVSCQLTMSDLAKRGRGRPKGSKNPPGTKNVGRPRKNGEPARPRNTTERGESHSADCAVQCAPFAVLTPFLVQVPLQHHLLFLHSRHCQAYLERLGVRFPHFLG